MKLYMSLSYVWTSYVKKRGNRYIFNPPVTEYTTLLRDPFPLYRETVFTV